MSLEHYPRYTLIVKGDAFNATQQVMRNLHMPVAIIETQQTDNLSRSETRLVIVTFTDSVNPLNEWFTSDSYQGPPFPYGSLLYWSKHEELNTPALSATT